MPTALAEWTPQRPDVPGFYWWMLPRELPEVVDLRVSGETWNWLTFDGSLYDALTPAGAGSLWWPVPLIPPAVG